jgi:Flp pilus assembly protein TadG
MWIRRVKGKGREGLAALEMALVAPIFFLLLFGTIEISLIEATQQLMENAAYNTSRLAKTGFTNNGQTQSQTVSQLMVNELQSFGNLIDTTKVTTTSVSYTDFAVIGTGGTSGYGTAQQIVTYTISYPWTLFTPMLAQLIGTNGIITLTSRIVVRNEPY